MEIIPAELIVYIVNCFGLDVVSQLSFLMICKHCYRQLPHLIVWDEIKVNRHSSCLKHYDQFASIIVTQKIITLPRNVQKIIFSYDHDATLLACLPPSVKHLTLYDNFNEPLPRLPRGLKCLVTNNRFKQPVDHLPPNLKTLELGTDFNQPVDHLPKNLKTLKLGTDFNQPVDHLPTNLKALYLGYNFNQTITSLPTNLKKLYFAYKFNQSLDQLPNSLEQLCLGKGFDKPINLPLPNSLTVFKLTSNKYKHTLNKLLPYGLKKLVIGTSCILPEATNFSYDTKIYISSFVKVPSTFQVLYIVNGWTVCRRPPDNQCD